MCRRGTALTPNQLPTPNPLYPLVSPPRRPPRPLPSEAPGCLVAAGPAGESGLRPQLCRAAGGRPAGQQALASGQLASSQPDGARAAEHGHLAPAQAAGGAAAAPPAGAPQPLLSPLSCLPASRPHGSAVLRRSWQRPGDTAGLADPARPAAPRCGCRRCASGRWRSLWRCTACSRRWSWCRRCWRPGGRCRPRPATSSCSTA
jgi:hypothetical protein